MGRPGGWLALPNFAPKALVLAMALAAGGAHAAGPQPSPEQLLAELKRLAARVDKLEKRNAELESRLAAGSQAPADAKLSERVTALEKSNQEMAAALDSDRISESEPELATRVKALEAKTDSHGPAAKLAEALEGIKVEGSVAAVAQGINGNGRTTDKDQTAVNWRGDVNITLPGGDIGSGKGEFFTHLRIGQGKGVTDLVPTFTSTTNTLLFQQEGVPSSNTNAIVAEAWYQLTTPVGEGGDNVQFTVGKMDPFVFFDQNALADNEAQKFLNNVFVHNAMLDSGGATGADDYGFAPGMRLAYHSQLSKSDSWQASIAIFGAGQGAEFSNSFTQPFIIGQLEYTTKLFGGLPGTYRVYAWNNPQYESYDGSTGKNLGWGLSLDQQVHEDLALFTRVGYTMSGRVTFDRAVTVGAEVTGNAWNRGADKVGLAFGWLRSSDGFRKASGGLADFGYTADGAEKDAELYYRYRVNDHVSLTPDLQVIQNPGANPDADTVTAVGLRALYAF